MKRILIITYYWPPCGGAGVQRWLKFVKYLREFKYDPIVYTVKNGEFPELDHSLANDIPEDLTVLSQKIWEPYNLYKILLKQDKNQKINTGFLSESKKPKFKEKFSIWIRGNLFIPDARKFWIKPSIKFLSAYLSENPVKLVISTGPPHSMHLIAYKLKERFNIPWVSDFRDPWTNIDFFNDLMLTKWANKKHHILEQMVFHNSDFLITISKTMRKEFIFMNAQNVEVITNGYDTEDINREEEELDKKFSMAHIGTLVKSRNPEILWIVLSELLQEKKDFEKDIEIKLAGKVDCSVYETINKYGLTNYVKKTDYLSHKEAIKLQQQSQILLLLINKTNNAKGILTGKFFEYLSTKRPILIIGPPDGDAAEILSETNAGKVVDFEDSYNLKKVILDYYNLFKKQQLFVTSKFVENYSRRTLTAKLAKLLDKILEQV